MFWKIATALLALVVCSLTAFLVGQRYTVPASAAVPMQSSPNVIESGASTDVTAVKQAVTAWLPMLLASSYGSEAPQGVTLNVEVSFTSTTEARCRALGTNRNGQRAGEWEVICRKYDTGWKVDADRSLL